MQAYCTLYKYTVTYATILLLMQSCYLYMCTATYKMSATYTILLLLMVWAVWVRYSLPNAVTPSNTVISLLLSSLVFTFSEKDFT